MEKALKHGKNAVETDLDAAKVLQPCVGAFDFPAPPVSAQFAFVLEAAVADVFPVGNNQFCVPFVEPHSERVGIVAAIGYDSIEMRARTSATLTRDFHLGNRAFGEPTLGRADASCAPIGMPLPSTTTMHFVPFPRRVLPTAEPPFWR